MDTATDAVAGMDRLLDAVFGKTRVFVCGECRMMFKVRRYVDGDCPRCGRKYEYEEGHRTILTPEDWKAIKNRKKA